MTFWDILNIDETTDIKKIRHAYSVLSKECHPETEPEKFQQLYNSYQEALKFAKKNKGTANYGTAEKERRTEAAVMAGKEKKQNTVLAKTDVEGRTKAAQQNISDWMTVTYEQQTALSESGEAESGQNAAVTIYEFDELFGNLPEVAEGIEAFKEFFETKGKKDWKKFMTKPEFLRVQFNEIFAAGIADFLKGQTKYTVEALPFDMVKELYFAYYPFMEEHKGDVFEDGFDKLFKILYKNDRIENVIARHDNPSVWNEVVKYWAYYGVYSSIKKNGIRQDTKHWNMYLSEIGGRVGYVKDGVHTPIDENIYPMLGFLIKESPMFSADVYDYLISRFNLAGTKHSSRWQMVRTIYEALEEKGVDIEASQRGLETGRNEVRFLMEEIERLYCLEEEEDRVKIKNFFRSEIYDRHKLDRVLLDEKFLFFCCIDKKLFSKIFLEEYKAFYDELYGKVSTEVGKYMYNKMMFYMNNDRKIGENCREITENRQEWVLKYFFEEGFNLVWEAQPNGGMRTVYKERLVENLKALADLRHYERDLYKEGHLYELKRNGGYLFVYEEIEEKTTLSLWEFYDLLEQLMDSFVNKYFCAASERETLNELKERAERACGCNRN